MKENFGEKFLHQKDSELHLSEPVEHEQSRKELIGEKTTQVPAEKIANWMEVLEQTHTKHRDDPMVMDRIKQYYHKKFVIKEDQIPESYYEGQARIALERGHGEVRISSEERSQMAEVVRADQQSSLDAWVDYLTSSDADVYPTWAKYWAFTGMVKLSSYDKEKHAFGKRSSETVAPFPDLDEEALAFAIDAVIEKAQKKNIPLEQEDPQFKKILQGANFGKLYSYAIEKVTPASEEELKDTRGEWVKYNRGEDHMPLVKSLQGHGTGWCTASEGTAKRQLEGGDFYVYYTYKDGKPTVPRVAIRMEGEKIGEVRGVAERQNLDPAMTAVAEKKLEEFPDGELYQKKTEDMRRLTEISKKFTDTSALDKRLRLLFNQLEREEAQGQNRQSDKIELLKDEIKKTQSELQLISEENKKVKLLPEELRFLYELDREIEGFGHGRDPRVKRIRDQRDKKEDLYTILELQPGQMATCLKEITKDTKAFVGKLEPGIFELIQIYNIENVYTDFPFGRVALGTAETGGKSGKALLAQLKEKKGLLVTKDMENLMNSLGFMVNGKKEMRKTVELSVKSLGFEKDASTEEIWSRAKELGLDFCPPDLGPNVRLDYKTKGSDYLLCVATENIYLDRDNPNNIITIGITEGEPWIHTGRLPPDYESPPSRKFMFCLNGQTQDNLAQFK